MKAPFPWFGGKSKVADIVWDRFGDVANYVEPFFGSGAVLLERPTVPSTETINDLDCMVANFWRALQHDPDKVAHYADSPVNEADQHARHLWLCSQAEFREAMKVDPEFYDTKIAGWWVWGQCIWIGSGWCARQLPHLGNAGKGINRQLPHLGNAGTGVHRKLPHLGDAGTGDLCVSYRTLGTREPLLAYMRELAERIRRVRVCCGDWSRILGPSVTFKHGITGVFLDPPYADTAARPEGLYASDSFDVAHEVRKWAIENGDNPDMRIALCGYEGEHEMPEIWDCVEWKARGGYGSQGENAARDNAAKERLCRSANGAIHGGNSMSGYGLAYSIRGYADVVKGKGKRRNPNYGTGPAATPEPTQAPCAWDLFLRGMGLSERDAVELIGSKSQEWARIKTWVRANGCKHFAPEEILCALGMGE